MHLVWTKLKSPKSCLTSKCHFQNIGEWQKCTDSWSVSDSEPVILTQCYTKVNGGSALNCLDTECFWFRIIDWTYTHRWTKQSVHRFIITSLWFSVHGRSSICAIRIFFQAIAFEYSYWAVIKGTQAPSPLLKQTKSKERRQNKDKCNFFVYFLLLCLFNVCM